ncbi:MAG: hypothetical protein J6N76_00685, partial [Lachnospiraceae bacterium]|nr:hypothetical protein [Lachnospiraceae bacterium]
MREKYREMTREETKLFRTQYTVEESKEMDQQQKDEIQQMRMENASVFAEDLVHRMYSEDSEFEERKQKVSRNMERADLYMLNLLPEEVDVEQKVKQVHTDAMRTKTLSKSETDKRAKKVENKQQEHLAVMNFEKRYVTKRDDALRDHMAEEYRTRVKDAYGINVDYMSRLTEDNPMYPLLSDWAMYCESVTDEKEKKALRKNVNTMITYANLGDGETGDNSVLNEMEKQILSADLSVFDYKD